MSSYSKAHIDEIASNQWPHWIPIRHHFGIETFGMNGYQRDAGEGVVPEHDESGGPPELYYVATGHATFTVAGEEIDAPAGTCVWVTDADAKRSAVATADGTLVLAIAAASAPGQPFEVDGWDSRYLEND
ncbi:MAG: hypothetical protein QOG85_1479 [Gaiellaceae bacterium]|jgi:oxalate decarboxylase/phosphoglucose isomerase-like protein (cupin superfamily)|nr:hypothetical protein [Gaiellaceae bacterium]